MSQCCDDGKVCGPSAFARRSWVEVADSHAMPSLSVVEDTSLQSLRPCNSKSIQMLRHARFCKSKPPLHPLAADAEEDDAASVSALRLIGSKNLAALWTQEGEELNGQFDNLDCAVVCVAIPGVTAPIWVWFFVLRGSFGVLLSRSGVPFSNFR
ncbi:hypothetical protein BDB00DRAFT_785804 [Zychaea mexicana]|uniref:uncharacterized protein n=1 Tax=Zychaea mexicana TaxID=64656 RepID=UPI0022FDDE41|nr:uncharacterized protein BDB00DRAFT_785804 [Zychaea mexicana]KAI9496106.1 hypothetical protein BDB00DRAFT_785804 [Zychaea mexicana]